MKNLITTLFLSLFITTYAVASGGHSHSPDGGHSHSHGSISNKEVINKATGKVNQLASAGIIDISWKNVKAHNAVKKQFRDDLEWVIAFKNGKIDDPKKQTLYLFFSLDGHYIAANYSGK
ncbi:hypothetical protein GHNINEIG_02202 [Hydrogenovibrio crunogenus]|uniref:PepSY domain-containing protein n=1 Tax=Hydrogenovibrio crunogenus TaxID=39765 RepID=A0A4P7P1Y3_9GAMM|nr:DUF6488 family protein [Hydrogenovibrio crunogenus]QBZ84127.1 hypothetical protein GHNINEIG_02202 [Hydrogenovibrio crunogenus]